MDSSPLPLRICFSADLCPRVYLPDLTTSASLAAMDSVDLVALDFFVGAIAADVDVGMGLSMGCLWRCYRNFGQRPVQFTN